VATALRRSDMQSVVLKRTRTNSSELHIHRLQQSCASQVSNYTTPLLEVVTATRNINTCNTFYTQILYLSRGLAEELTLQLIRGVDWLHKQLISHSKQTWSSMKNGIAYSLLTLVSSLSSPVVSKKFEERAGQPSMWHLGLGSNHLGKIT
jgi:hypothetical protein